MTIHSRKGPVRRRRYRLHPRPGIRQIAMGPSFESLEPRVLLSTLVVNSALDNTTAGDGLVTLREAIIAANADSSVEGQAGSGADAIHFDESLRGQTITFAIGAGAMRISDDLLIDGLGASDLIIDAGLLSNIFVIDDGSTASQIDVTLRGLTLTGGLAAGVLASGGAIRSSENLTVEDSIITGNSAATGLGGGISSTFASRLVILNTVISGNIAGLGGGGISASGPSAQFGAPQQFQFDVLIQNSVISDNAGGGVILGYAGDFESSAEGEMSDGTLTVLDSRITSNDGAGLSVSLSNQSGIAPVVDISISASDISGNGGHGLIVRANSSMSAAATLAITSSRLSDNSGSGLLLGPIAQMDVAITSCEFARNGGTGIRVSSFTPLEMSIATSTIVDNRQTGVYLESGRVVIEESTISGNSASEGGGIYVGSASLTVRDSTLSENRAADGHGGGIYIQFGTVSIESSTLSGNSATGRGGGIYLPTGFADVTVANATISGNTAREGAGVYVLGSSPVFRNTTIADNHASAAGGGGGIRAADYVRPILQSTIVADNTAGGVDADLNSFGRFDAEYSLIENRGTGVVYDTVAGSNIFGQDPVLGQLTDNGGPTQTHALLDGSPAINAGSNPAELEFDQRGEGFPRAIGGPPDMGAYEYSAPPSSSEITILGQGQEIADGDATPSAVDGTDFGEVVRGSIPPMRTFIVRNDGLGELKLGPVGLSRGYELVEPLVSTLAPGESDAFTVRLNTTEAATFTGLVQLATNDADESDFNFVVTGSVRRSAGDLDTSFGDDGTILTPIGNAEDSASAMAIQPDGKIILVGWTDNQGNSDFAVTRHHADGTLDLTFGGDGKVTTPIGADDDVASAVAIQPDGKIIVVGTSYRANLGPHDFVVVRYNPEGTLDRSFGLNGVTTTAAQGWASSVAIASDGKIIVGGASGLNWGSSQEDFALARYHPDGTLDRTFGEGGLAITPISASYDLILDLVLLPDGKILAAGGGNGNGSSTGDFALARFNSDGSLDPSFDGDGKLIVSYGPGYDFITGLAIQADDKIVAAGRGATGGFVVARYTSDGTADTTFDGDGVAIAVHGQYSAAFDVAIQPDGRIVAAGWSRSPRDDERPAFARFNADGSLDETFGDSGKLISTLSGVATSVLLEPKGSIIAAGHAFGDFGLIRLEADGSPGRFVGDGIVTTAVGTSYDPQADVALQVDGRIVVAGYGRPGTTDEFTVARYLPDGSLDSTFDGDGIITTSVGPYSDRAFAVAVQGDGKIVVAGGWMKSSYHNWEGSYNRGVALVRYNVDGSLDSTFGVGGIVTSILPFDAVAYDLAIDSVGGLVVVGFIASSNENASLTDVLVMRYDQNGALDAEFGGSGISTTSVGPGPEVGYGVALQSDGRIVVAGKGGSTSNTNDFLLLRYDGHGILDSSFGDQGIVLTPIGPGFADDAAHDVKIQDDNRIVAAGYSDLNDSDGSERLFALARYTNDGVLDPSFGSAGIATTSFYPQSRAQAARLAIQADGRIVVAGSNHTPHRDFALARYNPDGTLDITFHDDGRVVTDIGSQTDDRVSGLAIQSDGRILLAGGSARHFALARYEGNSDVRVHLSARSVEVQYSDPLSPIVISASHVPGSLLQASTTYSIDGGASFVPGLPPSIALSAGDGDGAHIKTWTISGTVTAEPADYLIRVLVVGEQEDQAFADLMVRVLPEEATAQYSGDFHRILPPGTDAVVVALRATIRESDGSHGDLTRATVTFINRLSGQVIAEGVPVTETGSRGLGLASFDWSVNLGPADSQLLTIGAVVDGYYRRDASFDDAIITVVRETSEEVSGAGHIVTQSSGGQFSGDAGSRADFGFVARTLGGEVGPQGQMTVLFRSAGRLYEVRAGTIDSLVLDHLDAKARVTSTSASLTDVTRRDQPVVMGDGLVLSISMSDARGAEVVDAIGITLRSASTLLYSSSGSGALASEQELTAGELVVEVAADPQLLRYQSPDAGSDLTLQLSPEQLLIQLVDNGTGQVVAQGPAAILRRVEIVGSQSAPDALRVDLLNGDPVPVEGVLFDAGSGGADALRVSGGSFTLTDDSLNGPYRAAIAHRGLDAAQLVGSPAHDLLDASAFSESVTINGGDGHDTLRGGSGDDLLDPGGGDDVIDGRAGVDLLAAANASFVLTSTSLRGNGTKQLISIERASLIGSSGGDFLDASAFSGRVTLDGGDGNDTLLGGTGHDLLLGGLGDDYLSGGSGDDSLDGGDGHDSLDGGAGNDLLVGGNGRDSLSGGDGDDTLYGGNAADTLAGDAGADSLDGGNGSDYLDGGSGSDTLEGGSGNDTMIGTPLEDLLF